LGYPRGARGCGYLFLAALNFVVRLTLWPFGRPFETETALQLGEYLVRLAAHVLRSDDLKPIKILDADGATVASLAIEDADDEAAGDD
jgi:hypothetical protein